MNAQPLKNPLSFVIAYLATEGEFLQITQLSDPADSDSQTKYSRGIQLPLVEIEKHLNGGVVCIDLRETTSLPPPLTALPRQLGCATAAYVPILQDGQLRGLVLIGARDGQELPEDVVQSYARTVHLTTAVINQQIPQTVPNDRDTIEVRVLKTISTNAAIIHDLQVFYGVLHDQVRSVVGDHGFLIAFYDQRTDSISVPYLFEAGKLSHIDSFPLGEGLTSILVRTREPLLLAEDTEKRARAMGAKITGKPAQSWLGVPLLAHGEAIGAIIIQNPEKERVFNENDLHFMTAVAGQVSGALYNARLLDESLQSALQFETAAEIARDISSSLNLDELLQKAVGLIRTRFNFYHAAIFLIDLQDEFVVIREATGDAGLQMKRAGHKLAVGSKSIVGYAAGKGEALIVNDTAREAIYYANPLLPETRAEAAIPLKVGERILGVLDVQSRNTYSFSEDNVKTLRILADQLAIAVVNSELFAETQEHLAQHRLLHHITSTAASGTTLDEALQSAVNGLQVTLGGDRVAILLADQEKKMLEVKASVGYADDINRMRIPFGSGITGWAAEHRKTLRVNDVQVDTRYIEGSSNTRSEMAIPLLYRSELLGILNVESEQTSAYTENDEELLGTLGGSLAAIIANARLLEQIRKQAERERVLYEITDKIRRTTDMQTILTTTASELTRAVGASRAHIKITISEPATQSKVKP